MLDDTGCQVAPGIVTNSDGRLQVHTATFTQAPEPFRDVDGCVCAFAGRIEYEPVCGYATSEVGWSWWEEACDRAVPKAPPQVHTGGSASHHTHVSRLGAARGLGLGVGGQGGGDGETRAGMIAADDAAEGGSHVAAAASAAAEEEEDGLCLLSTQTGGLATRRGKQEDAERCNDCRFLEGVWFYDCGQHG
jgi:hypothetical protein